MNRVIAARVCGLKLPSPANVDEAPRSNAKPDVSEAIKFVTGCARRPTKQQAK